MNKLISLLTVTILFFACEGKATECFKFDLQKHGSFQLKIKDYPKIKGLVFMKFSKIPDEVFQFDCWYTTQGISCAGDDDGGSYFLNTINHQLSMTISYLALRDEDKELLLYRPDKATFHLGKKEKCSF